MLSEVQQLNDNVGLFDRLAAMPSTIATQGGDIEYHTSLPGLVKLLDFTTLERETAKEVILSIPAEEQRMLAESQKNDGTIVLVSKHNTMFDFLKIREKNRPQAQVLQTDTGKPIIRIWVEEDNLKVPKGAIFHELIHVRQLLTGRLAFKDDGYIEFEGTRWNIKEEPALSEYVNYPWEKEAHMEECRFLNGRVLGWARFQMRKLNYVLTDLNNAQKGNSGGMTKDTFFVMLMLTSVFNVIGFGVTYGALSLVGMIFPAIIGPISVGFIGLYWVANTLVLVRRLRKAYKRSAEPLCT